jgi:hypothetical protein
MERETVTFLASCVQCVGLQHFAHIKLHMIGWPRWRVAEVCAHDCLSAASFECWGCPQPHLQLSCGHRNGSAPASSQGWEAHSLPCCA